MRLFRALIVVFATLALALGARGKPKVVAAQPLLADFAHAIAGGEITLSCLLNAEADPHSYEPSPTDLRDLVHADIVIVNGLGLEPWIEQVVNNSGFHGRLVVASENCAVRLAAQSGTQHESSSAAPPQNDWDPHAWHDPANARSYVLKIRDALDLAAPEDTTLFNQRAAAYLAKIDALDAFAREQFNGIPAANRKLVTSHDSLQYLGHAYALKIVPIAGSRPDQEPSARELADLITFIKSQGVHAVFFEATSSPALARLVAEEAGVKVVRELCTDGLGAAGTPTGTYLEMFRSNVETITRALR